MKKKNIMLLIGNLSNGGAERSIVNLANELSKLYNVILVVPPTKKQDYECKVKIIHVDELSVKIKRFIGIHKVKKLKKKYNIDVTISYTTMFNFVNVMSKYKDKTIISVRNHLSTKKEGFISTILHYISSVLANKIVCCSKSVLYDQKKNYHLNPKKMVVIQNFCNMDLINKKNSDKMIENTIVTMARLVKHKGHKHIIKAMSLVVKEVADAKLLIFSRGPLKEELENLVIQYGLEDNVIFMDFHPDPYQFIKSAKAFILASDYEGFPNVIIEAMACGAPIIATDSPGGTKEILSEDFNFNNSITKLTKEKYGILIPSFINEHDAIEFTESEIMLKDAILELLNNSDTYNYYHKQSLKRIDKYSRDKIIDKWLNIIEGD